MTGPYRSTPKQRAASKRWYYRNRRRHIEAVRARQRLNRTAGSVGSAPVTVEQIRQRAAELFGTVAVAQS